MCAQYQCKADAMPAFPGHRYFPDLFISHEDKTDHRAEIWVPT